MAMLLTTVEQIQTIPNLGNLPALPLAFLNLLVGYADAAVKRYCKRDLVLTSYTEFHDGNENPNVLTYQRPIWVGNTTIAAGSNGAALPQATLYVASTTGFPPGTLGDADAAPPTLTVQTGNSSWTTVTYTGKTATTFTGCSGGTGTLATGYTVHTPTVWYDPSGYYGQGPDAFPDTTLLANGIQFSAVVDRDRTKSDRGLLQRIGGAGSGFVGWYPQQYYASGKLAASRLPCWPRGAGNIKVAYTAGYYPIPADLQYAAGMLAAYMVRAMPLGGPLSSESLGSYSYSMTSLQVEGVPELGSLARTLARYRESSW